MGERLHQAWRTIANGVGLLAYIAGASSIVAGLIAGHRCLGFSGFMAFGLVGMVCLGDERKQPPRVLTMDHEALAAVVEIDGEAVAVFGNASGGWYTAHDGAPCAKDCDDALRTAWTNARAEATRNAKRANRLTNPAAKRAAELLAQHQNAEPGRLSVAKGDGRLSVTPTDGP